MNKMRIRFLKFIVRHIVKLYSMFLKVQPAFGMRPHVHILFMFIRFFIHYIKKISDITSMKLIAEFFTDFDDSFTKLILVTQLVFCYLNIVKFFTR